MISFNVDKNYFKKYLKKHLIIILSVFVVFFLVGCCVEYIIVKNHIPTYTVGNFIDNTNFLLPIGNAIIFSILTIWHLRGQYKQQKARENKD